MGTKTKKKSKDVPCERVLLSRKEKLGYWEHIYAKAMAIMDVNLGIDKDAVYAACHAVQTASREMGIVENVMRNLGELDAPKTAKKVVLGWDQLESESGKAADA